MITWPLEVFLLKIAANTAWSVLDIEAYSCLKQSIAHWLINFEDQIGLPVTHPAAIGACEAHFNFWGPTPNLALQVVIQQITTSIITSHQVSQFWWFSVHVTPQQPCWLKSGLYRPPKFQNHSLETSRIYWNQKLNTHTNTIKMKYKTLKSSSDTTWSFQVNFRITSKYCNPWKSLHSGSHHKSCPTCIKILNKKYTIVSHLYNQPRKTFDLWISPQERKWLKVALSTERFNIRNQISSSWSIWFSCPNELPPVQKIWKLFLHALHSAVLRHTTSTKPTRFPWESFQVFFYH